MEKCLNCGKTVLIKTCFGNETLCKNCDSLVNASSWNKRDFASMEDLLEKKNNALQLAKTNNVSERAVDAIEKYFDEYIKNGFVTSINGRAGQILTIFENYCIVNTKSDSAKTSLVDMFYQFDYNDDEEPERWNFLLDERIIDKRMEWAIPNVSKFIPVIEEGFERLDKEFPYDNGFTYKDVNGARIEEADDNTIHIMLTRTIADRQAYDPVITDDVASIVIKNNQIVSDEEIENIKIDYDI